MITISSTAKKDPIPPLIKVCDVALLLSVSRHSVHKLIDSGDLKASGVSPKKKRRQHLRITRASLLMFYEERFGHELKRALENPFETQKP